MAWVQLAVFFNFSPLPVFSSISIPLSSLILTYLTISINFQSQIELKPEDLARLMDSAQKNVE